MLFTFILPLYQSLFHHAIYLNPPTISKVKVNQGLICYLVRGPPNLRAGYFFSCRGAKRGWAGVPASASLRAGAGGPVRADRTNIILI